MYSAVIRTIQLQAHIVHLLRSVPYVKFSRRNTSANTNLHIQRYGTCTVRVGRKRIVACIAACQQAGSKTDV